MKAVNWIEATRSAELLAYRYPAVLAEEARQSGPDRDQDALIHALGDGAKRQPLIDTTRLEPDEAERFELLLARHLDRARVTQERLTDQAGDPAICAELLALKADFLTLSRRLEGELAQVSGSQEPCAAKLSRLRALGDKLSFAAYALGLWGPGAGLPSPSPV